MNQASDITQLGVVEIHKKFCNKEVRATEIVDAFYKKAQRAQKSLNAFITLETAAQQSANELDLMLEKGQAMGPLAGVPIAVKDNFCFSGFETTAGSKILKGYIAPYNATVVNRLQQAGAIILGKTNLDEFAMGSSNENSAFGPVKNPWDQSRVPGGSSGGSAAAVAAELVPAAMGTDTGGSIRLPAHYCGIVGVKPTYGRVSRFGIVAYASSLDQAGPMANSVLDSAKILECIAGWDPADATTSRRGVPQWSQEVKADIKGLRVGVPDEYTFEGLDSSVRKALEETIADLKKSGAELVDVGLPHTKFAISTYYLIATSEASSNLARYDGVRFGERVARSELEEMYRATRSAGFGAEVKRRIMIGTYALSSGYHDEYYIKACKIRRLIQNDFSKAFQKCDLIVGPVASTPAFRIGEQTQDPLKMYLNDIFTTATNLAGLPALSLPVAFSEEGLPIGIQLTGRPFDETTMLNAALSIESQRNATNKRRPHVP